MSKTQTIIQKATSDKQFATLILRDPSKTLSSYKLSAVEINEVVDEVKRLVSRGIWPADD